ncbi:hypothetical protein EUX98_g1123 [Antrodiella citrinella]|uniref:Hydrophobin n=1 Tax=Antrodiella citrinella TaxID=2447956 RepID=A0A4V3XJH0_9APHY|nr:hypothetical protein EUX98_g1123 [Antrodiella citrinella]
MAPVFILTRAFAISALFVGALPTVWSAPVPVQPRFLGACREMGCFFAEASGSAAITPSVTAAAAPVQSIVPNIIEIIHGCAPPPPPPATGSQPASIADIVEDGGAIPNPCVTTPNEVETEPTSPIPSVVQIIDLDSPPPPTITQPPSSVANDFLEALETFSSDEPPEL